MKTLKEFLIQKKACEDGFDFAKDLSLEQFLNTCERGDRILWLFARMNPNCLRELTLAKAHCANTVRHLMKDERSTKAVDVAIAFGEGRATRAELDDASSAAFAAFVNAADATYSAGAAAYAAAARAADAAFAAIKDNQKLTADICRKYLPLKIWNNN